MAYCYRLKMRLPCKPGSKTTLCIRLPVPFKSRRASGGRFGYAKVDESEGEGADHGRWMRRVLSLFRGGGRYADLD